MITSYKCPNYSSSIPYDIKYEKLKCQHCDTEFDFESLEAYNIEKENKTEVCDWNINNNETAVDGKISYVCPACNGEVIGDENMSSTSCPYCGNAIIVGEKLSGILQPNYIIPFKLTENDAKRIYEKFISNKKLLPDDFKINNFIKKLNSIYVPYWLFDAHTTASIRFNATNTIIKDEGNYRIKEIRHYLILRDGSANFEKIPVDGSSKLDDTLLDSLEPFDYSDLKQFNKAYLANFLSDKYDQNEQQTVKKANERIKNSIITLLMDSIVGYDSITVDSSYVNIKNGYASYVLLPIYIFSTTYKGKIYQFAMNGQTGKFTGNLPMDKTKAQKLCISTFLISFIIIFIAFYIINGGLK